MDLLNKNAYIIRAVYQWCLDSKLTPYIGFLKENNELHHIKNNNKDKEIILNISADACSNLHIHNTFIEVKVRFSGIAQDIFISISSVFAIYAKETGEGIFFQIENHPEEIDLKKEKNLFHKKKESHLKIIK